MVDDAELDRAVTHGPAAIRALGEADRLAGQRLGEINLGVAPANGAVGANSSQSVAGRILGLAQHAIPAPRRQRVMLGRRAVGERRVWPLFIVDALESAEPVELLAQGARRRRRGVAQQRQVQPFEAKGGPLSERSRTGRPYSRNAASSTGQTCSVSLRPSAWQRRR